MTSLMKYFKLLKQQHDHVDHDWWPVVSDSKRFEIMLGCILTQNTNWKNVEKALENLHVKDMISPDAILEADEDKLKELVRPSGYYNQKTRRIRLLAAFVKENPISSLLKADWKELRKELLAIKGVGNETADSILLYALDKPVFVIDAYTKRIVSRWGLADKKATYHELQEMFMKELPEEVDLYKEYHALIVEHAKRVCKPNPLCEACKLYDFCEKNI